MTEKVRTIRLYGQLGSKFGRVFKLAVNSPREATRALCALVPGFEAYMMNASSRGMVFSVFVGKDNITEEQLDHPVGAADIRIAPVIRGSKRGGILQIIVGVVLVIVGAFGATWGWWAGGSVWGPALMSMGMSMIAGGVIQLLTPIPKGTGSKDSVDNGASYSFNGPVNTQAQGNPVPLLYGRLIVGSAVVSAGLHTYSVYVPLPGGQIGYKNNPRVRDDGTPVVVV